MSKLTYSFRRATLQDVATIVQISNDAFMADAFFKKPAYVLRFDEKGVANMVSNPAESGVFLLARDADGETVGSVHIEPLKKVLSANSAPKVSRACKLAYACIITVSTAYIPVYICVEIEDVSIS